jgi:RNA polymerase sigma-70 factor (ECF subfamily)
MDLAECVGQDGSSENLAEALARADRYAIRAVYREYHEQVRAFARRLLGSEVDAEEIVQEVFLALPKAMGRFRSESRLSTFVMGIAVNHARHYVRASARRRAAMRRFVEQEALASDPSELPDERLAREQLAELLLLAMDRLSEEQRIAFVLCEIEERSSREVSEILGIPSSTVRARVGLAREKLQLALEEVHR